MLKPMSSRGPVVRGFHSLGFTTIVASIFATVSTSPLALAQCFDWVQRPGTYQPSQGNSSAMTFDSARGCVVLFGWQNGSPPGPTTWLWGGSSWVRCLPANQPPNRYEHAMTFDSRRNVVVLFGGTNGSSGDLGDTWEWDGFNWTQRATDGPSPRRLHAMAYDSTRGVVVMFGGTPSSGQPFGDT